MKGNCFTEFGCFAVYKQLCFQEFTGLWLLGCLSFQESQQTRGSPPPLQSPVRLLPLGGVTVQESKGKEAAQRAGGFSLGRSGSLSPAWGQRDLLKQQLLIFLSPGK